MNRLWGILFLMVVSNSCFAWSLLEPKDFDECILENMKGVTSDVAAHQIRKSCRSKFPYPNEKISECTLQEFTSSEMAKLQATGNVNYGYFKGNVYNGSQKTIREILVIYKTSSKSESVEYKISDLNIKPSTSGNFSSPVHDKSIFEWTFIVKGCD